jgi:hypothetical protein
LAIYRRLFGNLSAIVWLQQLSTQNNQTSFQEKRPFSLKSGQNCRN